MDDSLPLDPPPSQPPLRSNVPEMSVSELAFSLKRTLEDTYGRVRVRGELSKVKIHTSGHMYSDLKDMDAVLSVVCWRGNLAKLSIRPEEGLEVICTGRITTYPQRSNYQLVIESMELAGEGALLKMLEDRKKRLAAEGLFAPERKKPLPFLPEVIGVVTSPTGAVIRDILHRLNDRFPRRVLVWPVAVQGEGAAAQIAAAINGFNALPKGGAVPRPDLLIVARGGGSIEDLMAFNDEGVVRAAAASAIPLISAVGHETDTTLIDFASDHRAPTPTAAAERAVPRRIDLLAQVRDDAQRLMASIERAFDARAERLNVFASRLGDPARLLEVKAQNADHLGTRMDAAFDRALSKRRTALQDFSSRLTHPRALIQVKQNALQQAGHRLDGGFERMISSARTRLAHARPRMPDTGAARDRLERLSPRLAPAYERSIREREERVATLHRFLKSLSFESVLERGYTLIRGADGRIITDADSAPEGTDITINFRGGRAAGAKVTKNPAKPG